MRSSALTRRTPSRTVGAVEHWLVVGVEVAAPAHGVGGKPYVAAVDAFGDERDPLEVHGGKIYDVALFRA